MKKWTSVLAILTLCPGYAISADPNETDYSQEDLAIIQSLNSPKYNRTDIENYAKSELDFSAKEDSDTLIHGKIPSRYGRALKTSFENIEGFSYEGGSVTKLKKLLFRDRNVVYYVFENKSELILDVDYEKNLATMKSIRIGDSRKSMIEKFGRGFYKYNPDLYAYQCGDTPCEVQFFFESDKLEKISIVFQLE